MEIGSMSEGLPCPQCNARSSRVTDSRPTNTAPFTLRRRRECTACGCRFSTSEIRQIDDGNFLDLSPAPSSVRRAIKFLVQRAQS
jgi:hypothetical protein